MKYTFETEDEQEAKAIIQSKNLHMCIWSFIHHYLRNKVKYDDSSVCEEVREHLFGVLSVEGIDIDIFD